MTVFPDEKIERYMNGQTRNWSEDEERGYNRALLEVSYMLTKIQGMDTLSEMHPPIIIQMLSHGIQNRISLPEGELHELAVEVHRLEESDGK